MQIDRRQVGDVMILELDGRFVRGVGERTFRETLDEILESEVSHLLLDLSDVPFIDSSGIGALVAAKRAADEKGVALKLIQIEERVAKTLRLSMILPLFETYSSEEEALSSFANGGESAAD